MFNEFTRRQLLKVLSAISMAGATASLAQSYPARSVKLIVPFPPGGSTDVVARLMAQRLGDALKQPVVVENKPGVGSLLGTDFVAKATPDWLHTGHGRQLVDCAWAADAQQHAV